MAKNVKNTSTKTEETAEDKLAHFKENLEMHTVEVIGGKKFEVGLKADCTKVIFSPKYRRIFAVLSFPNGENATISPEHLKAVKALSPATKATVEARNEDEQSNTLYIPGKIVGKEGEKSFFFRYGEKFTADRLPKSLAEIVHENDDGSVIIALTTWKARQLCNNAEMFARLVEKQAVYDKIVNPPKQTAKKTK